MYYKCVKVVISNYHADDDNKHNLILNRNSFIKYRNNLMCAHLQLPKHCLKLFSTGQSRDSFRQYIFDTIDKYLYN